MATPSIRSQSSLVVGSAGTLNVPYPPTIVADDVILLCFGHRSATIQAAPAGFTLLNSHGGGGNNGVAIWAKRATGAESGSVARTITTTPGFGIMLAIQNVPASLGAAYFEGAADSAVESNNGIPMPTIITSGLQRLAIAVGFTSWNAGNAMAQSGATGESGGNWTNVDGLSSSGGNDGAFTVQQAVMATGGTISGGRVGANTSSGRVSLSCGVAIIGLEPVAAGGSYVQVVG